MTAFSGTLVALGNGLTACTTAAVLVGDPATVNCPEKLDNATPSALSAVGPRKTWMRSPALNGAAGVNSIACPLLNRFTEPDITAPLSVTCSAPVTVAEFIAVLVKSVTIEVAGIFVAP